MSKSCNYVAVGGQALMEGIMMRGPKGTAMSCRLPDGTIETEMKEFTSVRKKYPVLNTPFIRGIISFVESMILGYRLLMESAEKTTEGIEAEESDSKLDKWLSDHFGPKMMAVIGTVASVFGIGLAFLLFFYLPTLTYSLLNEHVIKSIDLSDIHGFNFRPIIEGAIRIVIFVFYMWATSKMKDIKRVYMYHGAEHKTIFCFEHGHELTVENVLKEKRFHPRCGTSFIFVTILLSILISSVAAMLLPRSITETRWLWIIIKLLLLPLIMGIGFEFIQLAGKYPNRFTRLLSAPGLAMQRITTAEPDGPIAEVAIEAMKACLSGEAPPKEEKAECAEAAEIAEASESVEVTETVETEDETEDSPAEKCE